MRPLQQRGVTLIELMVAMTLGLVILGSALQVFSANKQSFRLSQALARIQEDGRFAMQSMAGYVGCSSRQQVDVNTVATGTPPSINLATALFGFDNGTGWWLPATPPQDHLGQDLTICDTVGGGNAICQTSDILQLIRGSESAVQLNADMASTSDTVRVRQTDFDDFDPPVTVGGTSPNGEDLVLITDCRRADLFRVTASTTAGSDQVLTPNTALQQCLSGQRRGDAVNRRELLHR